MLLLFKILGITLAIPKGGDYRRNIGHEEYHTYGHMHGHNSEGCGPHHYCIEPGIVERYLNTK
jgi:hypothetical protein